MSCESSTHILNSTLSPIKPYEKTFNFFGCLPKELRLQIWEAAVPRERLIRIYLRLPDTPAESPPPRYLEKNHLGKPISGPRYRATVGGHETNSKFLRVNKEARDVALAIYRIQMPLFVMTPGPDPSGSMTLYLSPEHDMFHIEADAPVKETLVDFFWDMKAYDPKGVGLLKMAIDLQGLCNNDLQYLKRSDLLLIRQRDALVETLTQLREVWFVYIQVQMSWMVNGGHLALRMPVMISSSMSYNTETQMTTSSSNIPFASSVSTFDRIGRDPRKLAEGDLARLDMGSLDPRELIWRWKRLLRTWGIRHEPQHVDYRLLMAQRAVVSARPWPIDTVADANKLLTIQHGKCGEPGAVTRTEGPRGEEDGCRGKATAVGYWLFPADALGSVADDNRKLQDMDFEPFLFKDMRNSWPELLLSRLC